MTVRFRGFPGVEVLNRDPEGSGRSERQDLRGIHQAYRPHPHDIVDGNDFTGLGDAGEDVFPGPDPRAYAGFPGPARALPGTSERCLPYVVVQLSQPLLDIATVAVRHRIHSSPWCQ